MITTMTCSHCQRGAPFNGPYRDDQCYHCWLFANDAGYRALWSGEITVVAQGNPVAEPPQAFMLGDAVESALKKVGITKERVSGWLGEECNCQERQEKLNRLGSWVGGVARGFIDGAKETLELLMG